MNLARERSLYQHFAENAVQSRQADLQRLQEQLGTGYRINRPSDDPTAFGQARRLELLQNRYDQYDRAVTSARTWTDHTQQSLDHLAELFTQVTETGVRMANGTWSAEDREVEATKLESALEEIVGILNAKSGDEYLFAGSRTTLQPFTQAGNTVTYQGNDEGRERQIGREIRIDINVTGQDLHDTGRGYTITEAVSNLVDAVRLGDAAAVGTALEEVNVSRDHVLNRASEAGMVANRLTFATEQLADLRLVAEGRRSEYEDTDYAEAAMSYQRAQTGLQTSLRMAAELLQTSILDFLK